MRAPAALSLLLAAFVAAGCEQVIEPNAATRTVVAPRAAVVAGPTLQLAVPASMRVSDHFAGSEAINPSDYVCPASTPVSTWWRTAALDFRAAERPLFDRLNRDLLATQVVTYQALLFETSATPQYFGYNGAFTEAVRKAERDVKRFWDINSADIEVLGLHGTVLLDVEKVAATYKAVFTNADGSPISDEAAAFLAGLARDAVLASQKLNRGNHPLFTFNAFAATFDGDIPDKVVLGDAMLEGFAALGFGDVAPRAIFAHEFSHHIQYQNAYLDDLPATASEAEKTRYAELMADAYAAYYLTHARGASMNKKRVKQFLEVFYQIGDCGYTSAAHHGTPNQRMRAAELGFTIADQAQKQGHILSSEAFHALFVAAYPSLIAPDAP